MRVVPVLDLKAGVVVRGIAGRRDEYRPWISPLANSSDPCAIAQVFRDRFGLKELYLADLDAIAGNKPEITLYQKLKNLGFSLWVDAGLRKVADAVPLDAVERPVAGLETLSHPDVLLELGPSVVFSLDLKNGRPLISSPHWPTDAWSIVETVLARGVSRVLILDLAQIGTQAGPTTADFCRRIKKHAPNVEVATGGGVRGRHDLQLLHDAGVDVVLVASALHEGKLDREDLQVCP